MNRYLVDRGGAHRRWGHRNEAAGAGSREAREAPAAEAEAPPPPPAMVDLLDMEVSGLKSWVVFQDV